MGYGSEVACVFHVACADFTLSINYKHSSKPKLIFLNFFHDEANKLGKLPSHPSLKPFAVLRFEDLGPALLSKQRRRVPDAFHHSTVTQALNVTPRHSAGSQRVMGERGTLPSRHSSLKIVGGKFSGIG